jgi:hypothetical protein
MSETRESVLARTRDLRTGLDVACLIDTTGTMSVPLNEVRRRIREIASEIGSEIPRARLGIVCFKDHGDEGEKSHYLTRIQPLTRSPADLSVFLDSPAIAPGHGGGGAEGVECALRAANQLAWRPWARKAIVLVGDKPPHGAGMDGFDGCPYGVDYREEVEELNRKGVRIYTVLVDSHLETQRVFEWMSETTGGKALQLHSVRDTVPLLISICLAGGGRDVRRFAAKLRAAGRLDDARRELILSLDS